MVKAKEIREMALEDIKKKEEDLKGDLFKLRFQKSTGQLVNVRLLKEVKCDLARFKTVLRELDIKKGLKANE